jgi:3'(2'), 5'-bisphosphate nucleotidase
MIYCIAVGFMIENTPKLCAIHIPDYGGGEPATFYAIKRNGAYAAYNGSKFKKIKVSNRSDLKRARFCLSKHNSSPKIQKFIEELDISETLWIDSMAKFCKIADGSYDSYLRQCDNYYGAWDFLPGDLLIEEAGGRLTDLNNKPIEYKDYYCSFSAPGFLASNSELHEEILRRYNEFRHN